MLSFTASEAWGYLPGRAGRERLPRRAARARTRPQDADALEARYGRLFEVRAVVQGKLEEARRAKLIGSGLEAMVTVRAQGEQLRLLEEARAELPALFIVSKVVLAEGPLVGRGGARARGEVRALLGLRRGRRAATRRTPPSAASARSALA